MNRVYLLGIKHTREGNTWMIYIDSVDDDEKCHITENIIFFGDNLHILSISVFNFKHLECMSSYWKTNPRKFNVTRAIAIWAKS